MNSPEGPTLWAVVGPAKKACASYDVRVSAGSSRRGPCFHGLSGQLHRRHCGQHGEHAGWRARADCDGSRYLVSAGAPRTSCAVGLGLVAIFWSPVIAWRDMYRERNAAIEQVRALSQPDIRGEIDAVILMSARPGFKITAKLGASERPILGDRSTGILVTASITNHGAPSVAQCCELFVQPFGSSDAYPAAAYHISDEMIIALDKDNPMPVYGRDALYTKTAERPVERGMTVQGRVFFKIDMPYSELNRPGTIFILKFRDYAKKQHEAKYIWSADPTRRSSTIPHYPGLTAPPRRRSDKSCGCSLLRRVGPKTQGQSVVCRPLRLILVRTANQASRRRAEGRVASRLMWKIERRSSGIPSIAGRDRHRLESRRGGYQGYRLARDRRSTRR